MSHQDNKSTVGQQNVSETDESKENDENAATDPSATREEGNGASSEGISIFENEEINAGEKDSASYVNGLIAEISSKWDPKNANSEIGKLNGTRSSSHLSVEGVSLLNKCIALSKKTDGKLDITLYPLTRLWGFESESPKKPESMAVSLMHSKCGMETITASGNTFTLEKFTMLDVSAVANGFTADLISQRLEKEGYGRTSFSIGDHVRTFAPKEDDTKWSVELPDVFETGKSYGTLSLGANLSASTKGSYQKYYEENGKRYCNIFDPETGNPVDNDLVAVTIICKEGITADAYATACFVLGKDQAASFYKENTDFEMILVCKNGEILVSEGIADSFLAGNNHEVKVIKK